MTERPAGHDPLGYDLPGNSWGRIMRFAAITGWGMYVPDRVLTNDDLAQFVDTSDEWIRSRTGIRERRVAAEHETAASMATHAGRFACEKAGIDPSEIELVVAATFTPDQYMPSVASVVQGGLGANRAAAFDLNAACSGFVYALAVGTQFIQAGTYSRVLVVGVDLISRFLNYQDRSTCVLFGDGAGAVILEPSADPEGVLAIDLGSDGDNAEHLTLGDPAAFGGLNGAETIRRPFIEMNGQEVFRFAVKMMGDSTARVIRQAGLSTRDIDLFIPHQANQRIIDAAAKRLAIAPERVWVNVDRYGNTSAASIPICLVEADGAGALRAGMNVAMVGVGGGLSWASAVVRWSEAGTTQAPAS
jgi:3-oxoacyl-[acyl-carrier-protein] synthase-3